LIREVFFNVNTTRSFLIFGFICFFCRMVSGVDLLWWTGDRVIRNQEGEPLAVGCMVQLIQVGADGTNNPARYSGDGSTGDDGVVQTAKIGDGYYPPVPGALSTVFSGAVSGAVYFVRAWSAPAKPSGSVPNAPARYNDSFLKEFSPGIDPESQEFVFSGESGWATTETALPAPDVPETPLWMVFEGRSRMQRLDPTGGKRGEAVLARETRNALLVVNWGHSEPTNAVLISWSKAGLTQDVVVATRDDSTLIYEKRTQDGHIVTAERKLWIMGVQGPEVRFLFLGRFDGTYRYNPSRIRQRASMNGSGIEPYDAFSADLLRLNQSVSDALNQEESFDSMAAVLRTRIKKLPADITDDVLSALLQSASGE